MKWQFKIVVWTIIASLWTMTMAFQPHQQVHSKEHKQVYLSEKGNFYSDGIYESKANVEHTPNLGNAQMQPATTNWFATFSDHFFVDEVVIPQERTNVFLHLTIRLRQVLFPYHSFW